MYESVGPERVRRATACPLKGLRVQDVGEWYVVLSRSSSSFTSGAATNRSLYLKTSRARSVVKSKAGLPTRRSFVIIVTALLEET